MRKASIFVRLLAFSIDILLLAFFMCLVFIATIAGYALSPGSFSAPQASLLVLLFVCGSFLAFIFYFTYLTMEGGATVGKSIFQLKVVRPDGKGLNFFRAFVRSISYLLSLSFWLISLLIALFFEGRMIHDIIAGSRVVEEEL
jgi:uncharacterized RDD family membrane protein YckC